MNIPKKRHYYICSEYMEHNPYEEPSEAIIEYMAQGPFAEYNENEIRDILIEYDVYIEDEDEDEYEDEDDTVCLMCIIRNLTMYVVDLEERITELEEQV